MTKQHISATVSFDDDGIRLDRWFKRTLKNVPFTIIAKLIRKGSIRVNAKKEDISFRLKNGDVITYPTINLVDDIKHTNTNPKLEQMILGSVIFKDENIIVINKPAGIAVQGGTNIKDSIDDLAEALKFDYPEKPKLVHRIDKETSGLLVLARKTSIAAKLSELFRSKDIKKTYLAILIGVPRPLTGEVQTEIENEEKKKKQYATSNYEVLDYAANEYCLCSLEPLTGRKHQLRIHTSHIGTPILGDTKYARRIPELKINQKFMYLHAHQIEFKLGQKLYNFSADVPQHFTAALSELGLNLK